jgi:long-chain acyl-CoA synthetase
MALLDYVNTKYWIKSYPKDLEPEVAIPEISLPQFMEEAMKGHKNHVALLYQGREIKYGELLKAIELASSILFKLGVRKGETVALFLPNCPNFVSCYYGALKVGAMVTALSPLFMAPEVEFQLRDSGAKTLVVEEELWPRVAQVCEHLSIPRVIVSNLNNERSSLVKGPGVYSFSELSKIKLNKIPRLEINPKEDVAALQYTGGTTGFPKAAMLTHQNIVANICQMRGYFELLKKRDGIIQPKVVSILPWYHIYGQTVDLSLTLSSGGTIIVLPVFEADLVLKTIHETRAHVLMGVSTMFIKLLDHPRLKEYDLRSLIWCNNGATIIPAEVVKCFEEKTGVKIVEGYGLSEASPVTHTTSPYLRRKIGSVGPPLPNTLQAIINPETCEFLKPGEIGELVVHGPQVMKGYWNKPDETDRVFLYHEGLKWLRTGDIGSLDNDGYFIITDRSKELIKYKGHSVYPSEIEEVLYQHPAISQAAVIGIPDSEVGEKIKAFVVLKEEFKGGLTEAEIIAWTRTKMAAYKYPRAVEFRAEIPHSAVGKILRRVLREEELKKIN